MFYHYLGKYTMLPCSTLLHINGKNSSSDTFPTAPQFVDIAIMIMVMMMIMIDLN